MEKHTVSRLVGAPPGYVGFDQGGLLTDADPEDAARGAAPRRDREGAPRHLQHPPPGHGPRDAHRRARAGRPTSATSILIMTTNAGAQEMAAVAIGFGDVSRTPRRARRRSSSSSRPEFRNRARRRRPLRTARTRGRRARRRQVHDRARRPAHREARARSSSSPAARRWLAERGYDKTFGARPMARLIQEKIKRVLAEEMLFGQLKDGGKVEIDVAQGDSDVELAFTYSPLPPSKLKKRHRRDRAWHDAVALTDVSRRDDWYGIGGGAVRSERAARRPHPAEPDRRRVPEHRRRPVAPEHARRRRASSACRTTPTSRRSASA